MSELGSYTIEKGDPDPRGWTVVTTQGDRVGTVDDLVVDTNAMKVRHLIVNVDDQSGAGGDREQMLLDADDVELRHDRQEVFARNVAEGYGTGARAHADTRGTSSARDHATLTRSEEELRIGKREVERGEAVIAKHVETERISEPVTRRREELVIERRPVEAGARRDATIGDEEVRIPLMEEEVIVEKRPVVKEELVVGKRIVEERDVVEADVRREEFDIDEGRIDPSRSSTSRRRDH